MKLPTIKINIAPFLLKLKTTKGRAELFDKFYTLKRKLWQQKQSKETQ